MDYFIYFLPITKNLIFKGGKVSFFYRNIVGFKKEGTVTRGLESRNLIEGGHRNCYMTWGSSILRCYY